MTANIGITSTENWHASLMAEFAWFREVLSARIALYFGQECPYASPIDVPVPDLTQQPGLYARWAIAHELTVPERLVVMLALAPEVAPEALDPFFIRNATYDRVHSEFGGFTGRGHAGFLPTHETALFLLAGDNPAARLDLLPLLQPGSALVDHWIIDSGPSLTPDSTGVPLPEPATARPLALSAAAVTVLRDGGKATLVVPPGVPGTPLTSRLEWDDLVVPPATGAALARVLAWIEHGGRLHEVDGLGPHLRPGHTILFHGPSGTGKTLAAALVGKKAERPVISVDLAQLVSKYIGETEKNLDRLFTEAERRGWILFFDEADALFGKRTSINSSNDRYANMEVGYMLQRLEAFSGLAILASNLVTNFDDAFLRRFHQLIHFPLPDAPMRERLIRDCLGSAVSAEIDARHLATKFTVSGATIVNAIRHAWLSAYAAGDTALQRDEIEEGFRLELAKEGKSS
ncbi:ATP-binding protein [Pseudokordiimonas caeni]|uniref:ATP-binding protein n=1 Tax=Pseudokordiimonas caeni TaxID=2997908 RepID=UPI0028126DFD|nr:ATP-binding protein [Pseudokordiimonas caeni]